MAIRESGGTHQRRPPVYKSTGRSTKNQGVWREYLEQMGTEPTDCVCRMNWPILTMPNPRLTTRHRTTVEKDRLGREHLRMNFHVSSQAYFDKALLIISI